MLALVELPRLGRKGRGLSERVAMNVAKGIESGGDWKFKHSKGSGSKKTRSVFECGDCAVSVVVEDRLAPRG